MVHHLTADKTQIQSLSGLDHLIAQNDLNGQLNAFLLSCKVDELSPATLSYYRYTIGACVKFCYSLQLTDAQHITAHHIRLFLLKLQERNKPRSVHDYYRAVKRFFNWLIDEGVLEKSPMATIRPPRVPEIITQPFTLQQIANLLLLCNGNTFLGIRNRAIILTFLDTGLRVSEMAKIQISDLDFDRETITVMGKGAKERVVRIGKKAQKALLKYLLTRHDEYTCLWVSEERKPLTAWGIQLMIRRLGKRAGFNAVRCSPHTFRHTFATEALKNGAGEFNVQSLLGHSDLRMTRRYSATLRSEHAVEEHRKFSPVDRMNLK